MDILVKHCPNEIFLRRQFMFLIFCKVNSLLCSFACNVNCVISIDRTLWVLEISKCSFLNIFFFLLFSFNRFFSSYFIFDLRWQRLLHIVLSWEFLARLWINLDLCFLLPGIFEFTDIEILFLEVIKCPVAMVLVINSIASILQFILLY